MFRSANSGGAHRRRPGPGALVVGLLALAGAASATDYRPEPAAPILFTPLNERGASFSADGREVVFTVRLGDGYAQVICVSHLRHGKWSEPVVAPFSGLAFDADPYLTPDGRTLYFASNRSADGKGVKRDFDIWVVERAGAGWGAPHPLPGKVNSPGNETSPVLTRSGKLYFASSRAGGGDLFVAERGEDGSFGEPVSLGDGVNSPAAELGVAVSPDEKTLVFTALGRDDETFAPGHLYVRGDLYVSHWTGSAWGRARHLPPPVNSAATDAGPFFSADGRWFCFTSERGFATDQTITLTRTKLEQGLRSTLNGRGNIYRIDARALEDGQ